MDSNNGLKKQLSLCESNIFGFIYKLDLFIGVLCRPFLYFAVRNTLFFLALIFNISFYFPPNLQRAKLCRQPTIIEIKIFKITTKEEILVLEIILFIAVWGI